MRFTRRLLERRTPTAFFTASSLAAAAILSCSDDPEEAGVEVDDVDGAADVMRPVLPDGADETDASDAGTKDAEPVDAARLPVVCASQPCARSLVTTLADEFPTRTEGYCALLDDGTVACWGTNKDGQLGRGEDATMTNSATPARVAGLTNVAHLDHTCAVKDDGEVWCWGKGPFLRSANEPSVERAAVQVAIPPATKIAMSMVTACALVADEVLCWGSNADGIVAPYGEAGLSENLQPRSMTIAAGAPVRDLALGRAAFALREDGTTLSWGANPPLGRVSSLFPDPYPTTAPLSGIGAMDVVVDNVCAVSGGTGYCWGAIVPSPADDPKELKLDRALPEPVIAPEPLVQIATTRSYLTYPFEQPLVEPFRWCAVSSTGSVYCTGLNGSGQAGDGTKQHAYEVVKVVGLPGPAAEVRTLPLSTCALLTTGDVYCWGNNFDGQLGTGQVKGESWTPKRVVLP